MTDRAHEQACCRGGGDGFTIPGAEASYAPDLSLEPKHIEVRLAFDIPAATARGTAITTLLCRREGAQAITLEAVGLEEVEVFSITGRPMTWRYDGRRIHITWSEPFTHGEERRLAVRYRVTEPVTGMVFSRPDAAYPDRPLFVATDHETERARYWLPCVDYPAVRTTFDFHLTAPREMTILANGILVGEEEGEEGTKTAHWHLEWPCPSYLCCLAVGKFVRCDDGEVEGRPVSYFAAGRFTPAMLRRSFGRTPKMLRWIQERLGNAFPFRKYFQIALPEIGGAMENISLVTWDDVMVLDETLAREWERRIDSVNIHEMAHSYFGDAVVCRHFEHSWLKESWATYIETVWLEETAGRDERDYELYRNAEAYFDEADTRYVRPIVTRTYNTSWNLFDRHLYPGGAWRIHMLRSMVGDAPFWTAVREYIADFSGKTVETDDFRRKLEEHGGVNLTRFFDQWIHGAGYPKLKISFRHDAAKSEGVLVVEQTQEDAKRGVGLFRFDLDVAFDLKAEVKRVTIPLEKARHELVLPMAEAPQMIRLDPDCRALFRAEFSPGDDILRRTLTGAKEVFARIRAARALIETGTRENLRAVREAMAKEPFWGVREAVATALGASKAAEAIAPLADLLVEERDDRAKAAFARACGKMRDERLRAALLRFLAANPPYWARAAALESLGLQRDERDAELLEAESRRDTLHSIVRSGALMGLGHLRSAKAMDRLAARLPYGAEPEAARPAATEAFARAAMLLERERRELAAERLVDLTRDPRPRVRLRAAEMLAELGLPGAAPALESLKARQSNQEGPRIDRLLIRLREGRPGEEAAAAKTQMEKLEEKLRKLEERLQGIEARQKKEA